MKYAPHRSAFATLTVIGAIALVAVMFLALGALLTTDGRRTIQHSADAQLRQMLIAGAAVAQEHAGAFAQSAATQPVAIELPQELTTIGGKLQLHPVTNTPTSFSIRITAELTDRTMNQTLIFARENNKWIPTEALLEPSKLQQPAITRPTTQPTETHSPISQ